MAFGLNFDADFFKREGDEGLTPENFKCDRPISVFQALVLKTKTEWNEIAREVFGL